MGSRPGQGCRVAGGVSPPGYSTASGRTGHADAELFRTWIATPIGGESADFLKERQAELTAPQVRELLESSSDDTVRRHLAILSLADAMAVDEVYQIVTDTAVASERALDLVEASDLDQLALILAASPEIATAGITDAFLQAVIALASEDYDSARQVAGLIAEHGNANQREALAIRLRAFASRQSQQSQMMEIADIIWPDSSE